MNSPERALSQRFMRAFRAEFHDHPVEIKPNMRLIADLGFDSLDILRTRIVVEMFVPVMNLPDDVDFAELRVSDLVEYVVDHEDE